MTEINCGHCKGFHNSVAEVKECSKYYYGKRLKAVYARTITKGEVLVNGEVVSEIFEGPDFRQITVVNSLGVKRTMQADSDDVLDIRFQG